MENAEAIVERLQDEAQKSCYPSEKIPIKNRYKDISLLLHKKYLNELKGSFLSFGSRRSSNISNYGNTPTFMRKSISSNGIIGYSFEQKGSSRLKKSEILPSIPYENSQVIYGSKGSLSKLKSKEELTNYFHSNAREDANFDTKSKISQLSSLHPIDHAFLSETYNIKGSNYDLNPYNKLPNTYKDETNAKPINDKVDMKHAMEINNSNKEILQYNTSDMDINNCIGISEKIKSCNLPDIQTKLIEGKNSDLSSFIKLETKSAVEYFNNDQTKCSNSGTLSINYLEDRGLNVNNSKYAVKSNQRLSLRHLPRRSPTPPKNSPNKSPKERSPNKLDSTNKNKYTYLSDDSKLKESFEPSLNPLNERVKRNDLAPHSLIDNNNKSPSIANSFNIGKDDIIITPSYSNPSIYANEDKEAQISPPRTSPSFKNSFNHYSSCTKNYKESKKMSDTTGYNYLYNKSTQENSIHSKENEINSKENFTDEILLPKVTEMSKLVISKGNIRSIPFNFSDDMNEYSDKFINTNSSRLCSLM